MVHIYIDEDFVADELDMKTVMSSQLTFKQEISITAQLVDKVAVLSYI